MLQEAELSGRQLPAVTLGQAMDRYAREVAPQHRGERWELLRLAAIRKGWACAGYALTALTAADVAAWRDARLSIVAPATVARELTLLRAVLEHARRDWGWLRDNPMQGLRWPKLPPSRKRRVSDAEVAAMLAALNYRPGESPKTKAHLIAMAFLFALETAMRAGEILGLTWAHVREKSATLPKTKNGDAREVPLSPTARALLALLPREGESVFPVHAGTRDAYWRAARDAAALLPDAPRDLSGLHFHDARAEAIWRLSKKLDVLELARVIGHRDPRSLMLYYDASADELADRL